MIEKMEFQRGTPTAHNDALVHYTIGHRGERQTAHPAFFSKRNSVPVCRYEALCRKKQKGKQQTQNTKISEAGFWITNGDRNSLGGSGDYTNSSLHRLYP